MIYSLLYAKLSPHRKRSINLKNPGGGICDQLVANLEGKLEMSSLNGDGKLPFLINATTARTLNNRI